MGESSTATLLETTRLEKLRSVATLASWQLAFRDLLLAGREKAKKKKKTQKTKKKQQREENPYCRYLVRRLPYHVSSTLQHLLSLVGCYTDQTAAQRLGAVVAGGGWVKREGELGEGMGRGWSQGYHLAAMKMIGAELSYWPIHNSATT